MNKSALIYSAILVAGVFISAVSQVLLKKSADKQHHGFLKEYLNPYVIIAYTLFVGATLMTVLAFKGIPLSLGPVLDSTGYLFVTAFGVIFFKEKINCRKAVGILTIIIGIGIYALS